MGSGARFGFLPVRKSDEAIEALAMRTIFKTVRVSDPYGSSWRVLCLNKLSSDARVSR